MASNMRFCMLMMMAMMMITSINATSDLHTYETVGTSNAAILNRLGLVPLEMPEGHHKKRVAGPEPPGLFSSSSSSRIHQPYSRRHGHRDSHVYVVKLPAAPPYYTFTKPHKSMMMMTKDDKITTTKNVHHPGDTPGGAVVSSSVIHQPPSVDFHGNGKPAKIYHWNLPVVKKIAEKKRKHAQFRMDEMMRKQANQRQQQQQQHLNPINQLNTKNIEKHYYKPNNLINNDKTIFKYTRNNDKLLNYPEDIEESRRINSIFDDKKVFNGTKKMYRLDSTLYRLDKQPNNNGLTTWNFTNNLDSTRNNVKLKKHRKKAAMSYYAPIITKTGSTSIHKNFPGNGKPKAFYVMENSRKPIYYHPLLP